MESQRKRHSSGAGRKDVALHRNTCPLSVLHCGDRVLLQNQTGHHPGKWDIVGTVVKTLGFNQYAIKVGGSGCITKRNRRLLWPITPAALDTTLFDSGAFSIPIIPSFPDSPLRGSTVRQDPRTPHYHTTPS